MNQTARWLAAGLLSAAVFVAITVVAGQVLLPLAMANASDRWVVAAGLGVAVSAIVAIWSPSWAGVDQHAGTKAPNPSTSSYVDMSQRRATTIGRHQSGINSGDNSVIFQVQNDRSARTGGGSIRFEELDEDFAGFLPVMNLTGRSLISAATAAR